MRACGRGPMGSGMEEIYQITSALKHLSFGREVAVVTDARFSGVSTGACIGHVGPEALAGGPIGKLRDGDPIRIVVDRTTLAATVDFIGDGDEWAKRTMAPGLTPDPRLPEDTKLWAVLQHASGGVWGGCVYDVEAIGPDGGALALTRPDPYGWTVPQHAAQVTVRYKVFGDRTDGTYLGIDPTHAHMNMPATLMWARGLEERGGAGVELALVERGGGVDLLLPGRVAVAVDAQSVVAAPLDGMIVVIHVAIGSKVARGAAIASIRSPEGGAIRAEVDAAKAALEAAEALDVRNKRLFDEGVIPRQEWEATRAATLSAQAQVRAAEAQAVAMGSPTTQGVAVIRSPIAGVVTRIPATPGSVLDDGMEIATIADASRTELVFDAPPASVNLISLGSRIEARWTGGDVGAAHTGDAFTSMRESRWNLSTMGPVCPRTSVRNAGSSGVVLPCRPQISPKTSLPLLPDTKVSLAVPDW